MITATYKATRELAPVLRWAWVANDPPGSIAAGSGGANPLVGLNWTRTRAPWRWSGFLASTLPIGAGGGDTPDTGDREAMRRAVPARSAMDNALFAVNYWTPIVGVDVAWVKNGFTVQGEVTVLRLLRARGSETQDAARTNLTSGAHLGYFVGRKVSVGAELRYQRWLTDALPVRLDPEARETVSLAVGPRFHFKLGERRWIRPGLAYATILDSPFATEGYNMVQLDVPVSF
jgi:hypothetical protein